MSIRKMRRIEDSPPLLDEPLRPENLRRAFDLSEFAARLANIAPLRGVRKYASLEAAQAEEEEILRRNSAGKRSK